MIEPVVGIVVVAYNSRDHIEACLRAARDLDATAEVVVVDHGDDGTAEFARALGSRVLSDPSNPGFGAGQNRGVDALTTPLVLLLNPDSVVDRAAIADGVNYLMTHPNVAAVQGVIVNSATGLPERSHGRALGLVHLAGRLLGLRRLLRVGVVRRATRRISFVSDHVDRTPSEPTKVEAIAATALLVRREAFDQVGGFDPGFFLYGEDLDLCLRLRATGWELVALPGQWAIHVSGASSGEPWSRELAWWEGTIRYGAKWWARPRWAAAYLLCLGRALTLIVRRPSRLRPVVARLIRAPIAVRATQRAQL